MNANDLVVKANNRWKSLYVWQPILIAISIAMIVAIAHKVDWETTTVTNPSEIWESRKITENDNETVIVFDVRNNYLCRRAGERLKAELSIRQSSEEHGVYE